MIFESDPVGSLRHWVAARAAVEPDTIDGNTPLFADGLLDSADFVELLLLIEESLDRPLSDAELAPDAFRTIATIVSRFGADRGKLDVD